MSQNLAKSIEPNGMVHFKQYWDAAGRSRIRVTEIEGRFVAVSASLLKEFLSETALNVLNMGDGRFYIGDCLFEIIFPFPDYNYWHDCFLCEVSWSKNPLWTSQ